MDADSLDLCVEDIIISIYGTEMLLKQIRERQVRKCFYDWKYRSRLDRELVVQKKKYNKYMLDGFYALARQTQSICMLFHTVKLNELKLERFALEKLVSNSREIGEAELRAEYEQVNRDLRPKLEVKEEICAEGIQDTKSPELNEELIFEYHQNMLLVFHGINGLAKVLESKINKLFCFCFYRMLYFRGNSEKKKEIQTHTAENPVSKTSFNEKNDIMKNTKCESYLTSNLITNSEVPFDKENIPANKPTTVVKRPSLNKEDLYCEQISERGDFYTRKQNASFNNGSLESVDSFQNLRGPLRTKTHQNAFPNANTLNSPLYLSQGGHVIIKNDVIDLAHANSVLFPSLISPMNSNHTLNPFSQNMYANSISLNYSNPVLSGKRSGLASNSNHPQHFQCDGTPLNTTKYSGDNLIYSNNGLGSKRITSNQNFLLGRNSTYERKSPRSAELSKNILKPCINFTQDYSANLLHNIADGFKSAILN
ncbi:hypothetical protein HWI79_1879 [Cryptosporidium felis]|nr:hypothetical protein HWI79_1879 [Cryptosporidium felis]